jgi:hypothetical protein
MCARQGSRRHAPSTQAAPAGHARVHAPQWVRSELVSVHWLPQSLRVPEQVQAPFTHVVPPLQLCPQLPQFDASVRTSTQAAPQRVPWVHDAWHDPAEQTVPAAHRFAHDPQRDGFVSRFVHVPAHADCGGGQRHEPATHSKPGAHAFPQAPQLPMSVLRSTHARPQTASDPVHPSTHAPARQTSPSAHATPHAPQFDGSELVSLHVEPQRWRPAGHAHDPPAQTSSSAHATPHAPQLEGSATRSTHASEQLVRPGEHAAAQRPRSQTGAAPPQPVPHPPQFLGSVRSATHAPPHASFPLGHVQAPCEQTWLALHVVAHLPQW